MFFINNKKEDYVILFIIIRLKYIYTIQKKINIPWRWVGIFVAGVNSIVLLTTIVMNRTEGMYVYWMLFLCDIPVETKVFYINHFTNIKMALIMSVMLISS